MKRFLYIICLLPLVACTKPKNYQAEAYARCDGIGYGYNELVLQNCIEYGARYIPQIDSGKKYPTFSEFLCEKDGIKPDSTEYKACLSEKKALVAEIDKNAKKHLADIKREEKERAKRAELERKKEAALIEKQRKEAIARQLAEDGQKCKNYGFTKGTPNFAECMMKIEQARKDEENRQQQIAIQQQALAQQAEIADQQRRQAAAAALLNYSAQMQQTQAINNAAMQQQNQRLRTSCTTFGNTTNCY